MRLMIASAAMLAASAAMPAAAQYYGGNYGYDGQVIRCESNDGRTRECSTGGARVVLERQHSRSACIEGRTWGYGRDGIWVTQGCRADFRVVGGYGDDRYGYGGGYNGGYGSGYGSDAGAYGYGNTFRCESNDGRYRECATDVRSGVQLVRQLSRSACVEGRTWGVGRNGVWVDGGCRAEFRTTDAYYGNQGNGYGYGYGSTVRCESNDGRTSRCSLNGNGRAQLVRQLSRAACIEGRTWGSEYGSVWVSQGCRAEFTVSRGSYGGGWGNSGYGYGNQVFRCESQDGRLRECAANTRAGVQLVRQLSRAACIQGRTWGYGRNGIWVSDGCRGEFRTY